ncbi:MAG: MBL fold metallo-hydrolase [Candidatus Omnitrophica bacterium]|nr:MBL fold metallo-hydrolase [Candidatus Omnitrophota bacterium]
MSKFTIYFLDVGHGDCSYLELPNGAKMMIDCGGDQNWPSRLLRHYNVSQLDKLVISHPHGDHISDIEAICDDIKFTWLVGAYGSCIDKISDKIDSRKDREGAVKKFVEVVNKYVGPYDESRDKVAQAKPDCLVACDRFFGFDEKMDLNDWSWFSSISFSGHKVLFTGDMTAKGVRQILESNKADAFKKFVEGTTILKVPHHGRINGCSEELMELFGEKPLLCIISDKPIDDQNQNTANTSWYTQRTNDEEIKINGIMQSRKVLTTRSDGDIYLGVLDSGEIEVVTNCFSQIKSEILGGVGV